MSAYSQLCSWKSCVVVLSYTRSCVMQLLAVRSSMSLVEQALASKKGASAAVAAPAAVVTAAGTDGEQPVDNYNPLLQGCRSIEHYERIKYINEGAYGMVFAARNRVTGEVVAIKQVKMSRETQKEGFPITALRETNVLLSLHHPNIVR
eukprot:3383-Heterococcus_DN1.PRE.1